MSHDLRTPLAGIKAAVSSLRQHDVAFSPEDEASLLETIEESADRLTGLVANLLDMSRLPERLRHRPPRPGRPGGRRGRRGRLARRGDRVRVRIDDSVPPVEADAGLLDRVLANVLENALRHSPGRQEVVVRAAATRDTVQVRVVDRGAGVPDTAKEFIFAPFQRYGDAPKARASGSGWRWPRGSSRR